MALQSTRKKQLLIGFALLVVLAGVAGWVIWRRGRSSDSGEVGTGRTQDLGNGISVEFIDSSYEIADGETSGSFETGQKADMMLSGIDFDNTGGPLLFNHPGGIASDGTHLLLADRNNNRVLVWNELPTGNTPPDLVLGQKDFTANNPGTGLGGMNWPVAVATDGTRVLVADTYNDRILIWDEFPTENGQLADLELKGAENPHDPIADPKTKLAWPWAVWTNGTKLVVTSTGSATVLIWNSFPAQGNQPADIALSAGGNFGTPRSIGSDGERLVIGDHNAKPNNGGCGTFFWRSFPAADDQLHDFFVADPGWMGEEESSELIHGDVIWSPTFTDDGKLIGLTNTGSFIWDSFPESESDAPDLALGEEGGYDFEDGDGSGIASAGGKLYFSLSNGNKIVGYDTIPTSADQAPDFAVGSPDINTNTLETEFIMSNPIPASDGKSLFVSSDFDSKLYVWKDRPDESGVHPDLVYSFPSASWDNALYESTFALAGQQTVYVWNSLPTEGQAPDLIFQEKIGSIIFDELRGIAVDETYFYLADAGVGKIYIWEGIPDEHDEPKFTLSVNEVTRLSSDGNYLAATCTLGFSVELFRVGDLSTGAEPTAIVGGPSQGATGLTFNLPQGAAVSHGRLFIGDTGFNRVLIWEDIEAALTGNDPDTLLGVTELEVMPGEAKPLIGKDKLFWPAIPFFDGDYLWIGEFKFSERLLRFSPSAEITSNATEGLGAESSSGCSCGH